MATAQLAHYPLGSYQYQSLPADQPLSSREKQWEHTISLPAKSPPLLLCVDINGTIFTTPTQTEGHLKAVLIRLLADTTFACWSHAVKAPISYSDFLREHTIAKELPERERTHQFVEGLKGFFQFVGDFHADLYPEVYNRFNAMFNALKERRVFASFYRLIEALQKSNLNYAVILRTHGGDGEAVREEVHQSHAGFFSFSGRIRKTGKLEVDDEKNTIPYDFFRQCLRLGKNGIIKDSQAGRKKFPFDLQNEEFLPIFFDDKEEVVQAFHPTTNEEISLQTLKERRHLWVVDTERAICEPNYFIARVVKSIQFYNRRVPRKKFSIRRCLIPCCLSG